MLKRGYRVVKYPSGKGESLWYRKDKIPYSTQIRCEELQHIIEEVVEATADN